MQRLSIIVPLTIFFIFVLLYTAFNSMKYATLIIANVPFATMGGLITSTQLTLLLLPVIYKWVEARP